MATAMIYHLQHFWPFSLLKLDDLKASSRLVHHLPIPEQTKQFVFAIQDSKTGSVVYVLAVQNLSEQSVLDAENLIKEIQPDAVIAQVAPTALPEIQTEDETLHSQANSLPTSSFGVLRRCFKDKINRTQYENLAGNLLLREIFGTGFCEHLFVSKRAAEEVGACFLLLESPHRNASVLAPNVDNKLANQSTTSHLQGNHLARQKAISVVSSNSKRSWFSDPIQSQMLKSVSRSLSVSLPKSVSSDSIPEDSTEYCQPRCNFQAPPFARAVYSLLSDLHGIFVGLPAIRKALVYAQQMLADVNEGEPVDAQLLLEVHNFRVAVEGLRIALNATARRPLDELANRKSVEFDTLPPEEKCDVLLTQALRNQANNFRSVVAVVDVGSLFALRKHWNTPVPPEVALQADQGFVSYYDDYYDEDGKLAVGIGRKKLLSEAPVVAVGAGATAVLGASSLSKIMPASTFLKLVTYKIPAVLKLSFAQMQRTATIGLGKILGSSKVLAPGVASKASSLKVTVSAEKIRTVTHGVIASAERTSLLAMRTAFYELMRKRHVRPVRFAPLATFCCSMATCAGLLAYGDGIECAAESVPSAPMIASWGRGLQSLHQASVEVGQTNKTKIQEALQSLMFSLKK